MKVREHVFAAVLRGRPPGRLLDLATGHGTFALIAADMGWKVVAVDARTKRMPMTPGIEWVQADVREFSIEGDYDLIACLGLLYHLELDDQLSLLRRCAPTPLLIDTHVSLQPERVERGYEGHLFDELAGRTPEEHRHSGTASWGNLQSFWATEESLVRMLRDSGYTAVFRLTPAYLEDRTFFWCPG